MDAAKQLRDQEGFTVVEVLVASLLLVLASLAVFMTFSAAVKNVQRGKETQVGLTVAQREMEKVRALPYERIALTSTPTYSSTPSEPNYRISASTFNVKRTGTAEYAPLVVDAAGSVAPTTTAFSVGGTRVTVYRYVVWRKDAAYCATGTNGTEESCLTGKSYKRVIIAVVPVKPGNVTHTRAYFELQSDFVSPTPTP